MELIFIGTGAILSNRNGASLLVDRQVLVDCPNGIVKSTRRHGISLQNVELVCITHFHGDHTFDLPFLLLERALRPEGQLDLVIVGPSGIEAFTWNIFRLAFPNSVGRVESRVPLHFVEARDGSQLVLNQQISVSSFAMVHSEMECYGYAIEINGKTIGVSGDTGMCDNVLALVERSDACVLDMTLAASDPDHLGADTVSALAEQFAKQGKRFFATHMSDEVRHYPVDQVMLPDDFAEARI